MAESKQVPKKKDPLKISAVTLALKVLRATLENRGEEIRGSGVHKINGFPVSNIPADIEPVAIDLLKRADEWCYCCSKPIAFCPSGKRREIGNKEIIVLAQ